MSCNPGGLTIITPGLTEGAVAAQTVIQLDGDVVCHVDGRLLHGDETLLRVHSAEVRAFMARIASTASAVDVFLRWLAAALSVAVATVVAIALNRASGVLIALVMLAGALGAERVARAIRSTIEARLSSDKASLWAQRAHWTALASLAVVLVLIGFKVGRPVDPLIFLVSLLPGLLLSWAAHAMLRHALAL